jgi:hypothetical protein
MGNADLSSNGTFLNSVLIGKGNTVTVVHGDELILAHAPKRPEHSLTVVFNLTPTASSPMTVSDQDSTLPDLKDSPAGGTAASATLESGEPPAKRTAAAPAPPAPAEEEDDEMTKNLSCIICCDVLHDAVAAVSNAYRRPCAVAMGTPSI